MFICLKFYNNYLFKYLHDTFYMKCTIADDFKKALSDISTISFVFIISYNVHYETLILQ